MVDSIDQKIKGNDNIQQNIETQNITIINSVVSEEKIREISTEIAKKISEEKFALSQNVANERMKNLEDLVIDKFNKVENGLDVFQDPSFIYAYRKAQIQAAMTDDKNSYEMLSELLFHRKNKKDDKYSITGINGAIDVVNQISDSALSALTIFNCVNCYIKPNTINFEEGLNILNTLYASIISEELPNDNMWLDQLDVLKVIRINNLGRFNTFEDIMSEQFNGYSSAGIKEGTDEYKMAIEYQKECGFDILIKNPLLDGYYIVPIFEKGQIEKLKKNIDGIATSLSEDEKSFIYKIIDLYTKDADANKKAKDCFINKLDSFSSLKQIHIWWNKIPYSFDITVIGRVLGHANAQKCYPQFPPLY